MLVTGVDYETASEKLKQADGHVKTAIVMIKTNVSAFEAHRRLKKAEGFVKKALEKRNPKSQASRDKVGCL